MNSGKSGKVALLMQCVNSPKLFVEINQFAKIELKI
jgi:hypothetical protein